MTSYRHRQFGTLSVLLLGIFAVFTLGLAVSVPSTPVRVIAFVVLAVLTACLLLFWCLEAEVGSGAVRVAFGIGVIRRSIPLADIRDAHPVRNLWYYGWGIRLVPGGWMWNVSGLDAVELELQGGRRFRIGTDEPEALAAAIRRALPHNR